MNSIPWHVERSKFRSLMALVLACVMLATPLAALAQAVNPPANPTPTPAPSAPAPAPAQPKTPDQTQANEPNKVTLSADDTRWTSDDKVTATGNVKAVYQDFTVTGDTMEADLHTNIAVFKGSVKLITKQATVEGKDLTLNLKTREWSLDEAKSQIMTTSITNAAQSTAQGATGQKAQKGAPAFLQSATLRGDPKEIALTKGTFTTCDKEHPHYFFSARTMEIYPDNKVIAHNASMVGLNKKLISMGTLVIPIKGLNQNLVPQIGSSAEEGAFLKAAYAYTATEKSQGYLKLDLMQKRGVGIGLDHTLTSKLSTSQASIYFLNDKQIGGNNITGYLRHQQKLGAFDLNLTGNYRTNNYLYFPGSTSQDWQAALGHITTNTNTALTYRTSKTTGYGTSTTDTTSLRHTQQFTKTLSGIVSLDLRSYLSTGMTATDRELNSDIELRQRADKYDLAMTMTKRTDLDKDKYTGDSYYSSLDRLPELTFTTDSYRLGKKSFLGLPSRLQISAGRYSENQTQSGSPLEVTRNRLLLQWDLLGQNYDLGSKNELNVTGGFRQAYYASDQMQYVLKAGTALTTRFNDYLTSRVSYYYQKPEGYSPFRFDYTGKYNYTRAVVDYQDSEKLRWSLSSGYNFGQQTYPWQDMSLRLTSHPSSSFAYAFSTGYDLNRALWRNLISQFRVSSGDRVALDLGVRYDLDAGKIGLANGRVDVPIGKKWRIEGITSWNGITRKFDYKAFRLTRDLHCWEAAIVYTEEPGQMNDRGIMLELKIKAFPTQDRFGIGQYGQAIDTSMGNYLY